MDRKAQMDMKGMVVKYVIAVFFVMVAVTALSQIGLIGKITPGGGTKDIVLTGAAVVQTDVNMTKDVNQTLVNEEVEEKKIG
jgi:hypothetical protein